MNECNDFQTRWILDAIEENRKRIENLEKVLIQTISQKQPKFAPGERLMELLQKCQNGECTMRWLANEVENYIEEQIKLETNKKT